MSGKLAILYVDDDADVRSIVALSLSLDPAIEVRVAGSGAEALTLVDSDPWRPHAVVLDVMMPGMDGPTLMERLRTRPGFSGVPVIFMTAKGREADVALYRQRGAQGVILKPFDPVTLAGEVRALVAVD